MLLFWGKKPDKIWEPSKGLIGIKLNIAKAIITPLLDQKLVNPKDIYCLVNSKKSVELVKKDYKYKVNIFQANSKDANLVWESPVKLLSVKPQQFNSLCENQNLKRNENLIISILAGVSIDRLIKKFPNHNCARVVTNIPIIFTIMSPFINFFIYLFLGIHV